MSGSVLPDSKLPKADWVRYAAQEIREHGPEQFLVNLICVLRETMRDNTKG